MQESKFEKYANTRIRNAGGRSYKWVCPGVAGVPDRIVIFPQGRIAFVEFKRPDRKGSMSGRQKKICRTLQSLGCTFYIIGSIDELNMMLEDFGYAV